MFCSGIWRQTVWKFAQLSFRTQDDLRQLRTSARVATAQIIIYVIVYG